MTASDRFQLAWSNYEQELLSSDVFIPLSRYCREHHLSYSYMGNWLCKHQLSCSALRAKFHRQRRERLSSNLPTVNSGTGPPPGFISISPESLSNSIFPFDTSIRGIKGVSIIFPDGVQVSIREIGRADLNKFINEYNHKVEDEQPCLH